MSLEEAIKKWVVLDNKQKKLNKKIKDLKNKKSDLTTNIVTNISEKNIKSPIIKISDGRLSLIETQQANIISLKFLLDTFKEYVEDDKGQINY